MTGRFRTVVVAHGGLAAALADAARLIAGSTADLTSVDLDPDETPESFGERLRLAVPPDGADVLLLSDLHGGTPHNAAMALGARVEVRIVAGVSLAVVLEAITAAEPLTDALVERLVTSGRDALAASPHAGMVPRPGPHPDAVE